jgi:hypothetical protein
MSVFLATRLALRILRCQFARIGSVFAGVRMFFAMCPVRQEIA